jgi:hypothetical protein
MPGPKCSVVKGKIVCGKLHAGGKVPSKGGVFRLAKGEQVFSKSAVKTLGKSKKTHASKHKKKKCNCKH